VLGVLYSVRFCVGKSCMDSAVIHVTEVPMSKSHENVLPPFLAVTLGLILPSLKGMI